MPDDPHTEIYRKEYSERIVAEHLRGPLDFLQQLANFGSHLIPRAWLSSNREITDSVLINVLLKHVLVMLDGTIALLEKGAVLASNLQLRSLFEAQAYITHILDEDYDVRAKQYFVWHLRKRSDWAKATVTGTQENTNLTDSLKGTPIEKILEELRSKAGDINGYEAEIQNCLNSEELREVNAEFERLRLTKRGKRRKRDVSWYSVFGGPSSFADLCANLDLAGEYEVFYSQDSEVMHATTQDSMISHSDGMVIQEPIRNLAGFDEAVRRASNLTLTVFKEILGQYRPHELNESFLRRFIEEWQEPFRNIPKIIVREGNYREI
ncbi:MAG: DUF5677 domain-containing protein [Verrucomicrobiota bacterium]